MADKDAKEHKAAKEVLDRAEREIRHLTELGVDVSALADRFEAAKSRFGDEQWSDVQRVCGEVLVLAKSMQAIASASIKSGARGRGGDKISESMRMDLSRMVAAEVSTRIEAVARTLPTASSVEELVQTKIQEALVTGGLVARLESLAGDKAQAAIAGIPRFTAKDAQAAANLVVQRSLTQFLSSKELGTRITAAVENALVKALAEAEQRIDKSTEALVNTRVASSVSQLPTKEDVAESIGSALDRFLNDVPLEERILGLAAERAKAEVDRAPDLMSEAASKIAREEANALFKTHMRSQEFVDQVKQLSREGAGEIAESIPRLGQEDVEIIARGVADESLASLAESDVLREKIEGKAKEIVDGALSAAGFDDKAREIAQEVAEKALDERRAAIDEKLAEAGGKVEDLIKTRPTKEDLAEAMAQSRTDLMTNEDFASWIKDGALEAIKGAGLTGDLKDIEKKLLTKEKVERIARQEAMTAAMDLLEKKQFTKRIAELMDEKSVRAKIAEAAKGSAPDDLEETVEAHARSVFSLMLDDKTFVAKVKELAGGSSDAKDMAKQLAERIGRIEKEALPALIDKAIGEKLGAASADAVGSKVDEAVQKALASSLDPSAIQQQIGKIAEESVKDIANSAAFKAMLDEKFKAIMAYITQDVIPKQITRIMGRG